jgi:uncharacterized membrane protein YeaQ/YmgE (transglycosylase-associated protein family)
VLGLILTLIIIGLIAGALARLLVPGKDPLSIPGTILLGIVGSFIGGVLGYLLHHNRAEGWFHTSGLIGSIIGSIIALLIWRTLDRRYGRRWSVRR